MLLVLLFEFMEFWAAKATKMIKILDLFKNADIRKKFCRISMF